jgi:hypothetical protein
MGILYDSKECDSTSQWSTAAVLSFDPVEYQKQKAINQEYTNL